MIGRLASSAKDDVEACRAYVAAYIAYTDCIKAIHAIASGDPDKAKHLHAGDGGHDH